MDEINELKRSGMSIVAISNLTGYDREDESAANYSSAGWSPPEPPLHQPVSIFDLPAETVNHHLTRAGEFSTGEMGFFIRR